MKRALIFMLVWLSVAGIGVKFWVWSQELNMFWLGMVGALLLITGLFFAAFSCLLGHEDTDRDE